MKFAARRTADWRLLATCSPLLLALCWCSYGLVVAQQPAAAPPRAAAPAALAPGQVDANLSRVYVLVGKTGLGHEHGVEGRLAGGQVRLGAGEKAGELVFDMTSFVAETAEARAVVGLKGEGSSANQVTTNMLGPSVLDVARYPESRFVIHAAVPVPVQAADALPEYELHGEFALHGVKQPLRVRAQLVQKDGKLRLRGRFSILQSRFGITPYKAALGAVGVADQLDIWAEIWIAAAPGR